MALLLKLHLVVFILALIGSKVPARRTGMTIARHEVHIWADAVVSSVHGSEAKAHHESSLSEHLKLDGYGEAKRATFSHMHCNKQRTLRS